MRVSAFRLFSTSAERGKSMIRTVREAPLGVDKVAASPRSDESRGKPL
jgi:hypothetical protein